MAPAFRLLAALLLSLPMSVQAQDIVYSPIAGRVSPEKVERILPEDHFLSKIEGWEKSRKPCRFRLSGEDIRGSVTREISMSLCGDAADDTRRRVLIMEGDLETPLSKGFVHGVSVCFNKKRSRVKGVRLYGRALRVDTSTEEPATDRYQRNACDESSWTAPVHCPRTIIPADQDRHYNYNHPAYDKNGRLVGYDAQSMAIGAEFHHMNGAVTGMRLACRYLDNSVSRHTQEIVPRFSQSMSVAPPTMIGNGVSDVVMTQSTPDHDRAFITAIDLKEFSDRPCLITGRGWRGSALSERRTTLIDVCPSKSKGFTEIHEIFRDTIAALDTSSEANGTWRAAYALHVCMNGRPNRPGTRIKGIRLFGARFSHELDRFVPDGTIATSARPHCNHWIDERAECPAGQAVTGFTVGVIGTGNKRHINRIGVWCSAGG